MCAGGRGGCGEGGGGGGDGAGFFAIYWLETCGLFVMVWFILLFGVTGRLLCSIVAHPGHRLHFFDKVH